MRRTRSSVRKSSPSEVRRYGVQMRVESAWREPQQTVDVQAYQAPKRRLDENRTEYIEEYAKALGVSLEEAKRRLFKQRQRLGRTRAPPGNEATALKSLVATLEGGSAIAEQKEEQHQDEQKADQTAAVAPARAVRPAARARVTPAAGAKQRQDQNDDHDQHEQ